MNFFPTLLRAASVIVFFTLLSAGCSNLADPTPPQKVLLPLTVGSYWDNKVENYIPPDTLVRRYSSAVIGDSIINGEKYAILKYSTSSAIYFFINKPDGLYARWAGKNIDTRLYRYPVQLGDSYTIENSTGDNVKLFVQSLDKEIQVQAGSFRCYEIIDSSDVNFLRKIYIAGGIGEVLQLVYDSNGVLVARDQLVSYHIEE
jgi:hypothetical protein